MTPPPEPEEERVPAPSPAPAPAPAPPPPPEPLPAPAETPAIETPAPKPLVRKREVEILLNGQPMVLPPKENGQPYYLMDLLERSGVDFGQLEGPVHLLVNGVECGFSQAVKDRDTIIIR